MAVDSKLVRQKNGIYYTPEDLAIFLAEPLIKEDDLFIFDPAYGEGALLLASEKLSNQNGHQVEMFGCDIHPVNGLLQHLPEANLQEQDFFEYKDDRKFDLILTNPPYIRHQNQNKSLIKAHKKRLHDLQFLSNSSDVWAYFLVKCLSHIKQGGSIGAILPWSFIQANYAQSLRELLNEQFGKIRLLALNTVYFEQAEERIVMLWLENYGSKSGEIEIAFSNHFDDEITYRPITRKQWLASKLVPPGASRTTEVLNHLTSDLGFVHFKECADIRIGVVTGANKYFVLEEEIAYSFGFDRRNLQPILTTTKELPEFLHSGKEGLKRLILLDEGDNIEFQEYLKTGLLSGYDQRSHSKMRKPWYKIKTGRMPDAFFPYRVSEIPHLVLNHEKVQSTNSIHRIYFNGLSLIEMKWVFVSLMSIYGQVSLISNSKTYGRGLLKIEPGSLGNVLVIKKEDEAVTSIYNQIVSLLCKKNKSEAVSIATKFITKSLKIPNELLNVFEDTWNEIRLSNHN